MNWFDRQLTRALAAQAEREAARGYVLVRNGDTFMQPERVGLPFYWGKQGRPALYPTHAAASKAALMQGGVVTSATKREQVRQLVESWREANPDIVELWKGV